MQIPFALCSRPLQAFLIAERKSGGFDNCLALVRERGWRCWVESGEKRALFRSHIEQLLRDKGVSEIPSSDPVYRSAVRQRSVERVAVWSYACTYEALVSWYDPYTNERIGTMTAGLGQRLEFSRALHKSQEYEQLLKTLRQAVGYWYKGINADVRRILELIGAVRASGRETQITAVLVSNHVLIVGTVLFSHWVCPV